MALDWISTVAQGGVEPLIFRWPPVPPEDAEFAMQALALMKRDEGFLLAVPGATMSDDAVAAHSQVPDGGGEPLVGSFFRCQVPLFFAVTAPERSIEILVVDVAVPPADMFIDLYVENMANFPVAVTFVDSGTVEQINLDNLMHQVREWLSTELHSERLGFYSAQEDGGVDQPTPKATPARTSVLRSPGQSRPGGITSPGGQRKSLAKKPTVASLATQVEEIMGVLPGLTKQLELLTSSQTTPMPPTDAKAVEPQEPPYMSPDAARASAPLSSLLGRGETSSAAMALAVGPPPRTRPLTEKAPTVQQRLIPEDEPVDLTADPVQHQDPVLRALLMQSQALTALVGQLGASQADPMSELAGSSQGLGVKGTIGREKLQRELSAKSGQFYLKVAQAIHRRMDPSGRLPTSIEEAENTSLTAYLERYGGFNQQRELGLVMWAVAHIFNHASKGNLNAVRDHTALLAVMLEQAALDSGHWQVAWLLGLLDDPPSNLWLNRSQSATGGRRPFAPLCAQQWATVALAVIKENEVLYNKRSEAINSKGNPPYAKAEPKDKTKPRPKRRGGNYPGAQSSASQEGDNDNTA